MVNITIRLPEDVAAELQTGRVSEGQLDASPLAWWRSKRWQ
jgi:hypothetical protein